MALEFTDSNFQEKVLDYEGLTVVDFWASWCGPCLAIAPIIESLADEYNGDVQIGKVDVDQNQEVSVKYGVRSIPTILFLKNGEVVETHVGTTSRDYLKNKIEALKA